MKYFDHKFCSFNILATIAGSLIAVANLYLFSSIFSQTDNRWTFSASIFSVFFALSLFLVFDIYVYIQNKYRLDSIMQKNRQVRETLVGLQKRKIELESDVSTRIRTSLQVIRGYASMLVDGTLGALTGPPRDIAENILSQSKKINIFADRLISMPLAVLNDDDLKNGRLNNTQQFFSRTRFIRFKHIFFYVLALSAFLGTLAQIFLAQSLVGLCLAVTTSVICVAISFFVVNKMNYELKSLEMIMQLDNDLAVVSRESEALQKERALSLVQIETDMRRPLVTITNSSKELSLGTTDGISPEANEVANKIFELSESLTVAVTELCNTHSQDGYVDASQQSHASNHSFL